MELYAPRHATTAPEHRHGCESHEAHEVLINIIHHMTVTSCIPQPYATLQISGRHASRQEHLLCPVHPAQPDNAAVTQSALLPDHKAAVYVAARLCGT